jgi:hypothetical protein
MMEYFVLEAAKLVEKQSAEQQSFPDVTVAPTGQVTQYGLFRRFSGQGQSIRTRKRWAKSGAASTMRFGS